jgi:AraC-like DNA-binding protein
MVCNRCKMVVQSELEKFGLTVLSVDLGEVVVEENLNQKQKSTLDKLLHSFGFELLDDKKSKIIESVKNAIIELIYNKDNQLKTNLSDYLSSKLHQDYSALSSLFSQQESTTIEQYFILQKIERVKELLVYDELSLSEIADKLNYSSVAHLSKQFKKVTGLTPTYFKTLKVSKRKAIHDL